MRGCWLCTTAASATPISQPFSPFSGEPIPLEAIQIQGPNYRESLIANGLLSRNRAVLRVLERSYGCGVSWAASG